MSIAKAKANAIAITHRSVVGREPQTAILYSTPLCPPLILNCERFFLYEKNYQRQGRTFFWTTMILKFRIWTWLQIFATDGHTLFKTSSTEGSKSVDWETLFHRRDETFIGDNQTLYSTPLWNSVVLFIEGNVCGSFHWHFTFDLMWFSENVCPSKYLSYRDEAKQISR